MTDDPWGDARNMCVVTPQILPLLGPEKAQAV
jgi:hypothetical protein